MRASCPHHLGRRITDKAAQPPRGAACVGTERGTTAERTAIALAERGIVLADSMVGDLTLVGQEAAALKHAQRIVVDARDDLGDVRGAGAVDADEVSD